MREFKHKVAVVTGAASGIGKALVEKCLNEGMQVVLADVEETALASTVDEFQSKGHNNLLPVITDVSKLGEIEALLDATINAFGGVHLLFNNAGVTGSGSVLEASINDWNWVMGVNLWSVIYGVRTFVPKMIAQDCECHVVNTASVFGLIPGVQTAGYGVTKHGVVVLTESLYSELLRKNAKVKVSVLCPGFIRTNLIDAERNRAAELRDETEKELTAEEAEGREMFRQLLENGMDPSELAEITFQGIRDEKLYIQTHTEFNAMITARALHITQGTTPAGPADF
ncbi:MAG: SDR family NAD(P)-dependent oxidoreductase [Gammaproteobacteria bacterium]|nr:SDR family NAD(P)-dependent oxidoreductase [Gammaproteobacteria bacterium]